MQTLRASKCGLSTAQLPSSILDVLDALTKAGYEGKHRLLTALGVYMYELLDKPTDAIDYIIKRRTLFSTSYSAKCAYKSSAFK